MTGRVISGSFMPNTGRAKSFRCRTITGRAISGSFKPITGRAKLGG